MAIQIQTRLENNILFAEISADPDDISDANTWIQLFEEAQTRNVEGVFLINNLNKVMSSGSSAIVGGNKERFPTLKAIANYRKILPEEEIVPTFSTFRRIAELADVEYRTFYDYDEALSWLKEVLAKPQEDSISS